MRQESRTKWITRCLRGRQGPHTSDSDPQQTWHQDRQRVGRQTPRPADESAMQAPASTAVRSRAIPSGVTPHQLMSTHRGWCCSRTSCHPHQWHRRMHPAVVVRGPEQSEPGVSALKAKPRMAFTASAVRTGRVLFSTTIVWPGGGRWRWTWTGASRGAESGILDFVQSVQSQGCWLCRQAGQISASWSDKPGNSGGAVSTAGFTRR